jgi:hypothetical protein
MGIASFLYFISYAGVLFYEARAAVPFLQAFGEFAIKHGLHPRILMPLGKRESVCIRKTPSTTIF